MCLTFSQMSTSTTMPNDTSIFEGGGSCDGVCCVHKGPQSQTLCKHHKQQQIKAFLPLRWEMAKMQGVTMQCPWPGGNSAFRIFMVLCGFSCVSLLVVALIKKEFFWANWAVSTASTNRTVTNFEHTAWR